MRFWLVLGLCLTGFAASPVQARALDRGEKYPVALWPRRTIPYQIDRSITDPKLKAAIDDAAAIWSEKTGVSIRPARRGDKRPLLIRADPDCGADVGYNEKWKGRGGLMRLAATCTEAPGVDALGNALHEFGHVLGLIHEHQRPGAVVQVKLSHLVTRCEDAKLGCKGVKERFETLDAPPPGKAYDACSIMHYPIDPDPRRSYLLPTGSPPPICDQPGWEPRCRSVGQRCGPTASDLRAVRALYSAI